MDEQTSELDLSVGLVALHEEPVSGAPAMLPLPEMQPEFAPRPLAVPKKKLITTMTLTSETCKWPFGDPATPDFHYCGCTPLAGRPYCSTHEAISRPSSLRRKSA